MYNKNTRSGSGPGNESLRLEGSGENMSFLRFQVTVAGSINQTI